MQKPSIGRVVHYTLSEYDANAINKRRADFQAWSRELALKPEPGFPGADGRQVHYGNQAAAGDVYPAMVVRVFDPSSSTVNLQVFLDGNDVYWATSRREGEEPGTWAWPARV